MKFSDWFAIARGKYPFNDLDVKPIRIFLKGPRAVPYNNSYLFVARFMEKTQKYNDKAIELFHFDGEFKKLLTLAVGRDGSYAGLCWNPEDNTELVISFYSDHDRRNTPRQGKTNDIWVAKVKITP